METPTIENVPGTAEPGPSLSVLERAVAIFTRPGSAWVGLESRAQWWFPLLVMVLFSAGFTAALHQRALLPMIVDSWDEAVAEGRMTAQQAQQMESFMGGPAGLGVSVGQQVVAVPVITLFTALLLWFGVSFLLGKKMRFRLAFENVAWASLITLPGQILAGILAWSRETMRGLHVGFGALIPEADPPTKLQAGLGVFLDALGPLSIWYLVVLILGAAALSGAPRKSTAWVLGSMYVALMVVFSVIAAMMARGD